MGKEKLSNMKILVTGANGYIGRHVVKRMLDSGFEVYACDIKLDGLDKRAKPVNFNILDLPQGNIFETLGSPSACLHMAWRNGFAHNADTHIGDLSAHYRFLTALICGGLKKLAVMGTMHEVGYWEGAIDENTPCRPLSMYGIAKDALRRSMILYCKQHECIFQWLRGYYILGDDRKNNSIFRKILDAAERGDKTFPFTSGKNQYDFIEVDKLAGLITRVVGQDKVNGIINCCTGNPQSLADRVEQFIKDNNLSIKLDYGKFPDRPYDSPCEYGDSAKILQILGKEKV